MSQKSLSQKSLSQKPLSQKSFSLNPHRLYLLSFVFGLMISSWPVTAEQIDRIEVTQNGRKVAESPAATEQDPQRVRVERILVEAARLRDEATAESLRHAIKKFEEAIPLLQGLGDREGQVEALNNIGKLYSSLGEKRRALEYYDQALPITRALGDRTGEAESLNNIGAIYDSIGEKRKGIEFLNQSLLIRREVADRRGEAVTLNNIGRIYDSLGERPKALEFLNQALPLRRAVGDRSGEANTLNNIGLVYDSLGERQRALEFYKQTLLIRQAIGDRRGEAVTLNNIGTVHFVLGNTQKALDFFNQALPIRREVGDRKGEANTLSNLGKLYDSLGEKQKALEYYDQALPLLRALDDRSGEAVALGQIGQLYNSLGERQRALEYHTEALAIRRAIEDRPGESVTLNNIGSVYDLLGEKQKALELFDRALGLAREVGDRPGEAITLNNLGLVYDSLGEKQEALEFFNQALHLKRTVGDRRGEAVTLDNIGRLYYSLGERQRALEYHNQALLIRRTVADRRGEAVTLNHLGRVYGSLGEKKRALEFFNQALNIRREIGDRSGQAGTLSNLGGIYHSLGEHQRALQYYQQALSLTRAVEDRSLEAFTHYGIARVERDCDNLMEARKQMEASLGIIESLRSKIALGDLQATYFDTAQSYYEFSIDLLMRLRKIDPSRNYAAEAFQISERARARTLIELLAESRSGIRQGVDPALLDRERMLQQRLDAKADRLTRLLNNRQTEAQAAEVRKEIEMISEEYHQVQAQIRTVSPRYAALTAPQPLCLTDLQKQVLDSDTILLEYALGKERSYLWAVMTDRIESFELPPRAVIEESAKRINQLLTARNRRVDFEAVDEKQARIAQSDNELIKAASELSHLLLDCVAGRLDKKRLLIVTEGALQYVPFAALQEPSRNGISYNRLRATAVNWQPLIVNHEIIALPSASTLAVLRQDLSGRKTAPKTVAVLADPVFDLTDIRLKGNMAAISKSLISTRRGEDDLDQDLSRALRDMELERGVLLARLPYTRKEAQAILSLAPASERKEALDFAANQTTATSPDLGAYRYLHFATHGLFDPIQPELSGIVLSLVNEQGKEQDGFLRAHEIFNLHLPAELVVLSGCQTGLGKELRGEGLMGLTRAFMYAGAARVMVSLWEVNDHATAELMARLYRKMLGKERLTPAAALRAAQIEMWDTKQWKSPYFWAAFTLQGEPR